MSNYTKAKEKDSKFKGNFAKQIAASVQNELYMEKSDKDNVLLQVDAVENATTGKKKTVVTAKNPTSTPAGHKKDVIAISDDVDDIPAFIKDYATLPGYKIVRETKSRRMQLTLRPSIKDALERYSKRHNVSQNDTINEVLERFLKQEGELR